jgi:hypothetical protein
LVLRVARVDAAVLPSSIWTIEGDVIPPQPHVGLQTLHVHGSLGILGVLGDVVEQAGGGILDDSGRSGVVSDVSIGEEVEHAVRCRVGTGADVREVVDAGRKGP